MIQQYTIEYRLTGRGGCSLRPERWSQAQVIARDPETAGAILCEFQRNEPNRTFRFKPAVLAMAAGASA